MTVLVAIVVPVMLLTLGAFVINVGSWYSVRAQTQNGADAGAMAVATSCAKGTCVPSKATTYAVQNENAAYGNGATVDSSRFPCGHDAGGVLPACAAGTENGHVCPSTHPTYYVDVQAVTNAEVGLYGSLVGSRTKVAACAQATWGAPQSLGNAVALTISACEWLQDTNNGQNFASVPAGGNYAAAAPAYTSPPTYLDTITARRSDDHYDATANVSSTNFYVTSSIYDPRNPQRGYTASPPAPSNAHVYGSETVITTHGFGNSCDSGHSGWASPGQFGWLSNSSCAVAISGNTYNGAAGNSSAPCETAFTNSRNNRTPIYLPVYTSVNSGVYTLDGFAAFVVTGWDLTSGNAGNWNVKKAPSLVAQADTGLTGNDANYCGAKYTGSNSDVCIYGYFTQALIPASAVPGGSGGGTNLGATAPYLTG